MTKSDQTLVYEVLTLMHRDRTISDTYDAAKLVIAHAVKDGHIHPDYQIDWPRVIGDMADAETLKTFS